MRNWEKDQQLIQDKRGNEEHDGAKLGRMRRKVGKKGKRICVFGVKKFEGRGKGV
ncbi:MAG: hypothetical protein IKH26_13015 [Bacteroidaceae bacterium]|nr:hypothetical protein [Bacteroidaceae bacterium]